MAKYFSNSDISKMSKVESSRRSSESFFSSKSDNDNYFDKVKGNPLRVVGLEHVPANGDIKAFNVVKFDDGHQMSTNKFFSAKGLKWPVGGNVAKLNYLASALETDVAIEVVPDKVTATPMMRRDGTYVGNGGAVLQPIDVKEGNKVVGKSAPTEAINAVTYFFEEQELPKVALVNWEEA